MSIDVHEVELVAIQYVTENDLGGIEFFLGLGMTVPAGASEAQRTPAKTLKTATIRDLRRNAVIPSSKFAAKIRGEAQKPAQKRRQIPRKNRSCLTRLQAIVLKASGLR